MQQNNSDYTGLAQHALVLGTSGYVQSDPTVPAQSGNSDPTQENLNLHAWLLEPQQSRSRASLRQWQHEENQPDPSMRQSGLFFYKMVPQ